MPDARQSYDPYKLVEEVIALLAERGLEPARVNIEDPGARVKGASLLLRGLGIDPLMSPEDALDLDGNRAYDKRVHGD